MGKAKKSLFGKVKGQCATSELHDGSEDGMQIRLQHQSKISPATMAELRRRVGRSRFQGSVCVNCIYSIEGKSLKSVTVPMVQQTVNDFPNIHASHINNEMDMDISVIEQCIDVEPSYMYMPPDCGGLTDACPTYAHPDANPTETHSVDACPRDACAVGASSTYAINVDEHPRGTHHTDSRHADTRPNEAHPSDTRPTYACLTISHPTDARSSDACPTDIQRAASHQAEARSINDLPTYTQPTDIGSEYHRPANIDPSHGPVHIDYPRTGTLQAEDVGITHIEPVIVLTLGNLRKDLASLSIEVRALIAFELAAIERQNIRSDVLMLTKGDFRSIETLSDMCNYGYVNSRNPVLANFLIGLCDENSQEITKPTSTSDDLSVPLYKQSDIYKLAKAIEACMGLTMPIAVLPFHFREIVLLYSQTRSRIALSLLSASAPHGSYQTVRNWLDKLAQAGGKLNLPNSKGDTLCIFDNNQVLLRRWNICVDNRATSSVITMVMFLDIDSEGTLQFQEELKPCHWMWTNLDSEKIAALKEGHRLAVHQDTRYKKHFHPWLSGIIQEVAYEQSVLAGKCVDDVDKEVSTKNHDKQYKTCSACGWTEVPKTRRKCPSCDEMIRSLGTEKNKHKNKTASSTKNLVEGDVRVFFEKKDDTTYNIKYERSTSKATEYDHLPHHHPKHPPDVNIGEPIFVNPCSYEAVAGVFRRIGKQAGVKQYGGNREWLAIVCDGLPYVLGYQIIERTFECKLCGASVSGLAERQSHRSEHESACTFKQEFDWVLLQPGPGHVEMNMLKTFVKFAWPVFWEGMVEIFNFRSDIAKRSAQNVNDHHKGMTLARIARDSFAKELVLPYVRQELLKEKTNLSVAGYLNFAKNTVESPNYALMFDLTFSILDSIFLYRAGVRTGDIAMMDSGRAHFARMWSSRTHPLYRQLAVYDTIVTSCMPPVVQEFINKTKSVNLSGTPYTGEGADFKLEEVNKSVQHWIPAVPTNKAWKNACANYGKLSKLRQTTMKEIKLKEPKQCSSRSSADIKPEVLAFRTALRQKNFVGNHDKEQPLTSYGKEPLDEALANFAKEAAAKEAIFLETFIGHHESGGFKKREPVRFKEAPIFVTPLERAEYFNIRNKNIKDCVLLINSKIAEIEDQDMRKTCSEAFEIEILSKKPKADKQKYIDFYELVDEYQSTFSTTEECQIADSVHQTIGDDPSNHGQQLD